MAFYVFILSMIMHDNAQCKTWYSWFGNSLMGFSLKKLHMPDSHSLKPLTLKSAIWHKMLLYAQYLVDVFGICTAKRSWKDLHIEGIKLNPLLYETFTTPPSFGTFSLCTFRFKFICDNKQCTDSCKFSYSLGLYPICMMKKKILNIFLFSFWTLLRLISDLLHPC